MIFIHQFCANPECSLPRKMYDKDWWRERVEEFRDQYDDIYVIYRDMGGVRKSIYQSWLAKGLGLGLPCWGFKGVQEEIPWEEASILQIGSVAFPPVQCTSPQLHPCHRLTKMGSKTVPHRPYSPDLAPCDFWLFPNLTGSRYETIDEMIGCGWYLRTYIF